MKIKTNDQVKILAGKDKGKSGKVLQMFLAENRASIEGINLLTKHLRPRRSGEKGQRVEFPAPMNISNLALLCPKCGKATRVGYVFKEVDGKSRKSRVCKQCGNLID